jgi:hypothetical protein
MWRFNFRNGPNYPWREATAHVEIEPSQSHIETLQALKSEIKLKNATNLNANDMFNFIGKMLAGGAKNQFLALRRQFDEELRVKNAAASALHDRNKAAYDQAKIRWDALDAAARVGQIEPQAPAVHVDSEEFDRPVERFWVTMKELYPIKSPSRVKEFGTFAMLPDETIANLVQRMQTLKFALAV